LSKLFPGKFHPSFERNLKVHDSQKWVDSIFFLDNAVEQVFVGQLLVLVLDTQGDQVYSVLCLQLKDLHFLINFHVAILSPHASV